MRRLCVLVRLLSRAGLAGAGAKVHKLKKTPTRVVLRQTTESLGDWALQAADQVKEVGNVLLEANTQLESIVFDTKCLNLKGKL